nr:MAG TPA: Protein of unknown function (DUF1492) [Caudoviricetes sp.]
MTTKEYLSQISRYNRMINNRLVELAQIKELACSISAIKSGERVNTSPDPDKMSTTYAKIDEMERTIDKLIDEYVDKKSLIIRQIEGMENNDYYEILFSRYIEELTFEKIADKTIWCRRQIHRIHAKALKAFEDKYGSEYL